ncbi:MAG: HAD family hydrolase, partial [Bacteroidales bacterium]|nr:HAD family hydrolase [Bacteroidales bacterium]
FAEKLGVRPESCLYIGDSVYDALCAKNAGMDFALADWRGTAQPDIPAKYHLRRIEEIIEVVG